MTDTNVIHVSRTTARDWRPISTHPKTEYEFFLGAVTCSEEGLTHRICMWDPEIGDYTVFSAAWDPEVVFWMPLPELPELPPDYVYRDTLQRLIDRTSPEFEPSA